MFMGIAHNKIIPYLFTIEFCLLVSQLSNNFAAFADRTLAFFMMSQNEIFKKLQIRGHVVYHEN